MLREEEEEGKYITNIVELVGGSGGQRTIGQEGYLSLAQCLQHLFPPMLGRTKRRKRDVKMTTVKKRGKEAEGERGLGPENALLPQSAAKTDKKEYFLPSRVVTQPTLVCNVESPNPPSFFKL